MLLNVALAAQTGDVIVLTTPPALSTHAGDVRGVSVATLELLNDWLGPLPAPLTITGVRWVAGAAATSTAGGVVMPFRWLAPERDRSMARAVIGEIVRQYWRAGQSPSAFDESMTLYVSARAIRHLLTGVDFATPRFFGNVVPFPLRSVLLSPPLEDPRREVWNVDGLTPRPSAAVVRGVRALQSLERFVGWPTMLETISALHRRGSSTWNVEELGQILSEQRGSDLRFLVSECFHEDAAFDYAVADLAVKPGAANVMEATVTIARAGTGRFAFAADGQGDAAMPLMVRFADGTEFRDVFDGAAPSVTMVYSAKTPAVAAFVDPDAILLLDVNRENNALVRDAPVSKLGVRLALHWLSWLQNAMLSYTALV